MYRKRTSLMLGGMALNWYLDVGGNIRVTFSRNAAVERISPTYVQFAQIKNSALFLLTFADFLLYVLL